MFSSQCSFSVLSPPLNSFCDTRWDEQNLGPSCKSEAPEHSAECSDDPAKANEGFEQAMMSQGEEEEDWCVVILLMESQRYSWSSDINGANVRSSLRRLL